MSSVDVASEPAANASEKKPDEKVYGKREKRSITEIRDSKKTGEKMVYMSVPDYTSAQWAEMAGVDVAVLGDSLAMIAHGHRSTVPASMDMMIMHGQAVRRGAPNTFMLGCMPYQSYHTVDRALANASRFMQETLCDAVKPQAARRQVAGPYSQGVGRCRHPDCVAHRPDPAHHRHVRGL
jgi:3-methyl-2-oxobutanoate hydroxymethyltransferase